MPRSQYVDPAKMRSPGEIAFKPIPVCVYQKQVKDEKDNFSKKDLLNIYRDMCVVREFETMLQLIKTTGEYAGKAYEHPGPAHLGIGQEAAYVGQAYTLDIDDFVFGSHRSHGEILAKGLRSVEILPEDELEKVMKEFFGGSTLKVVDKGQATRQKALEFLIYGTLAEIFARETGFNKGLGGSMHAFFTPFGIYPNNAIVGGSGDISVGAAMYKKINLKKGLVVCNIGDGSMACGPVWEGLMLANMDQYKTLWDEAHRGGLPLIMNIFNNQYGMGGQTFGETMGYGMLARIGAGVNPDQMHAERVDGYNPLAVIDAYRRKKALIENKEGPALLDIVTYRFSGHSPSDAGSYRTKEELAAWQAVDSLITYPQQLVEAGVATQQECDDILANVKKLIEAAFLLATDDAISPRIDLDKNPRAIEELMFSNNHVPSMEPDRKPDVLLAKEENPRVQQLKTKERFAIKDGKPVSKNKLFVLRDGIFEAINDKFYEDPTLVAYGEENRDWGGAFAVYRGLTEAIPYHRLFNAPIAEGAIVGSGVGYALCGGRAVVELMYCDFLGRAGDEVFNQVSKWQSMSAGVLKMPLVIRLSVGSKYGAQHSQDWSALMTHIPGLKVVFPATPYDAKGLMTSALNGTDPVIFLESQRIYDIGEQFHEGGVPEGAYEIPFGEPDIKKPGKDLTILSIGATLYRALEAAKILEEQYGVSTEVIDARSLVPFNYDLVIESVKKTGRIVLAGDACERGSHLKEMAEVITSLAFDYLDAPVTVVGAKNWITPAHEMENHFFPQPSWIVDAVHERILPLKGHVAKHNFTPLEQARVNKLGV